MGEAEKLKMLKPKTLRIISYHLIVDFHQFYSFRRQNERINIYTNIMQRMQTDCMTEFGSFSGSHSQVGPREESQTRRNPNYLPSHTCCELQSMKIILVNEFRTSHRESTYLAPLSSLLCMSRKEYDLRFLEYFVCSS